MWIPHLNSSHCFLRRFGDCYYCNCFLSTMDSHSRRDCSILGYSYCLRLVSLDRLDMCRATHETEWHIDRASECILTIRSHREIQSSWKWCEQGSRLASSLSWKSSIQIAHCKLSPAKTTTKMHRCAKTDKSRTYVLALLWLSLWEWKWYDSPMPGLARRFRPFDSRTKRKKLKSLIDRSQGGYLGEKGV